MYFLGSLFKGSSENNISFYRLYSNILKWSSAGTYPYLYELPDSITLPADFWKKTIELYRYTKSDIHERAISVFWADGDLILSSVVKGTKASVTPKNKVSVHYKASHHQGYYRKEVYVDEKLYSYKDIYHKRVPKKIEVKYLFNMHTHPPHINNDGSIFYTFFSAQDIKSLMASKAIITGMIGDKLWLLFRTQKTPSSVVQLDDSQINVEFLIRELHIAIYVADFNQRVKIIRLDD